MQPSTQFLNCVSKLDWILSGPSGWDPWGAAGWGVGRGGLKRAGRGDAVGSSGTGPRSPPGCRSGGSNLALGGLCRSWRCDSQLCSSPAWKKNTINICHKTPEGDFIWQTVLRSDATRWLPMVTASSYWSGINCRHVTHTYTQVKILGLFFQNYLEQVRQLCLYFSWLCWGHFLLTLGRWCFIQGLYHGSPVRQLSDSDLQVQAHALSFGYSRITYSWGSLRRRIIAVSGPGNTSIFNFKISGLSKAPTSTVPSCPTPPKPE